MRSCSTPSGHKLSESCYLLSDWNQLQQLQEKDGTTFRERTTTGVRNYINKGDKPLRSLSPFFSTTVFYKAQTFKKERKRPVPRNVACKNVIAYDPKRLKTENCQEQMYEYHTVSREETRRRNPNVPATPVVIPFSPFRPEHVRKLERTRTPCGVE